MKPPRRGSKEYREAQSKVRAHVARIQNAKIIAAARGLPTTRQGIERVLAEMVEHPGATGN